MTSASADSLNILVAGHCAGGLLEEITGRCATLLW